MKLVAALFLVFVGTASPSPVENLEIVFPDDKAADFEVKLSGQAWLKSGPVALRNGDDWCSSDDGLKLDNVDNVRWDDYVVRTFTWVSTKNASYKTTTYLKMYTNHPVVVFGQVFDTGAAAGSKDGENNQLRSSFPTFQDAGADLGSIVFGGGQVNEAKTERWPKSSLSSSEEGSFPVVLFDEAMENTIVLSPLNTFMSSLQATWKTSPGQEVFGFGIMDSVNEIPEEYAYETVLVAGQNVTETMRKWGKFMQRFYNRDDSYRYSDYTINYLGYWTDNGACYHYCTGKYDNYEDALVDMKTYSDQQGIPYRYLQLDSWWYYKGTSDGVKNWTAMTTVFPHGLSYIADVWKTPIVAHNRMWSENTDYAKQNGGKYDFIVNGNLALPTEYSFWLDLMGNASRDWNLLVYEQDWLSTEYRGLKNLTTDLNLGRQWLMQMGNAARSQDLTIQYCMSFVRHLLQAVEIPVVTQIRVSGDYHPSNTNWQIGDSTILADSLGIAAFKDNFHSVKVEADCCKLPTTENAPELEATVAALSRGPVGIGDQVGGSDKELIMATCMSDGRLLKPTHPSKSLDSTFVQRAFGSNGPAGQLYAAYTEVGDFTWYYITAASMTAAYELKPSELPPSRNVFPKTSFPDSLAFQYNRQGTVLKASAFSTISIPTCGTSDFVYWGIAPVLPGTKFAFLGELGKLVPVSETRFQNIVYDSRTKGYTIYIVGDPGEEIKLTMYSIGLDKTIANFCTISDFGTATCLIMPDYFGFKCNC